jgi:hypothetical protein
MAKKMMNFAYEIPLSFSKDYLILRHGSEGLRAAECNRPWLGLNPRTLDPKPSTLTTTPLRLNQ